jgi:polygalacturonase
MKTLLAVILLLLISPPSLQCGEENAHRLFDVRVFGATGDGVADDRAAIQRAVDSCAVSGGTVLFPPGSYLTGSIDLGSNVDLYLQRGATILGSTRLSDYAEHTPEFRSYNDLFLKHSLFYAERKTNISLRGEGTIDGQGSAFPVTTRQKPERYRNRPFVIRFVECRNVSVSGLTLRNSAMWMQQYLACEDLTIRGIRVWNHCNQNNDMMDIDGCRNVVVADCVGDTEDDAITLKSTSPQVTENVTITNCVISSHCNAIKTGTESTGGFRNITVSNIVVKPSANRTASVGFPSGISGITLATVDGGVLERVSITGCVIDGPQVPIFIRLANRGRRYMPEAPQPGVGAVRDISISDVTAVAGGPIGCSISGIPGHPVERIRLTNVSIQFPGGGTAAEAAMVPEEALDQYPEGTHWGRLPAYGFYVRHAGDVSMTNLSIRRVLADQRPVISAVDVSEFSIGGLRADGGDAVSEFLRFEDVRGALVQGSAPLTPVGTFLFVTGTSLNVSLVGNDVSLAGTAFRATRNGIVRSEGNILREGPQPR